MCSVAVRENFVVNDSWCTVIIIVSIGVEFIYVNEGTVCTYGPNVAPLKNMKITNMATSAFKSVLSKGRNI